MMSLLRFKTLRYIDRACTGVEAFSMLIPGEWTFEGGIRWSPEDTMMPGAAGFRISGDGVAIQALPGKAFFWSNVPQVTATHPVGSKYLGAVVCPPLEPPDVIREIIFPALRPDALSVKIVEESVPDKMEGMLGFGAQFDAPGSSSSKGARARFEYRLGGIEMEEEIFCTITTIRFTVPTSSGDIVYAFWMADHIYSFSAEKGKLDESMDIFQSVMHSIRISRQWFEKYGRIVRFLKDRQAYRQPSLRQLSMDVDRISVANDETFTQPYLDYHTAFKWLAGRLDCIEHTGEYYDPVQQICVRLPLGYDFAWASGSGEYLLSNRNDIQPDIGFTEIWKIMEKMSIDTPGEETPPASA
jgi:hypothetical protein